MIALLLLPCLPPVAAAGELDVSANTPEVRVSTRPEGRNFMRLPTLRYDFVLNASCPDALPVRSISLSIADTRTALSREDITPGPQLEVSIDVPASQIAPVAVENFCTVESADDGLRSLHIPSVLSAQAALHCAGDDDSETTYASASLDVLLHCDRGDEPATRSIR